MKNVFLGSVFAIALVFSACDSSSGGAGPEPVAEVSSSSGSTRHCEEQTEGCDEAISSSSFTDKGTSSGGGLVSSSSVKSGDDSQKSSSGKNSSSSMTENPVVSSSSGYKPCENDEEGVTVYRSKEQIEYICNGGFWIPMSSSLVVDQSSSSKYYDMNELFNANLSYGEFVDPRDGRVYKTYRFHVPFVKDSVEYFAENLNYGKMIFGGIQQGDSTKYCYDDDPWYCENGFGGLYTWANAMNFPVVCDSARMGSGMCPDTTDLTGNQVEELKLDPAYLFHQGICPDGWHIMSRGEWASAYSACGLLSGSECLSSDAWMGVFGNPRGFSLLPAGVYDYANARFYAIMRLGYYWVPEEYPDNPASIGKCAHFNDNSLSERAGTIKRDAVSIRCVKDY